MALRFARALLLLLLRVFLLLRVLLLLRMLLLLRTLLFLRGLSMLSLGSLGLLSLRGLSLRLRPWLGPGLRVAAPFGSLRGSPRLPHRLGSLVGGGVR